jgi:hypothetical protein
MTTATESGARIYRIIRFRFQRGSRTVKTRLTLAEAQAHCSRPDTRGTRGGVRWFDGYDLMRGMREEAK